MKKQADKTKNTKDHKATPTHNQKLNYFGAGRLLDYLDA
jgi:hypothetical protein